MKTRSDLGNNDNNYKTITKLKQIPQKSSFYHKEQTKSGSKE